MSSLSNTHTHTWAGADVTQLAWSTVDDRLDVAAPETDRQSSYCSAGMIQRWDERVERSMMCTRSKTSWLFLN